MDDHVLKIGKVVAHGLGEWGTDDVFEVQVDKGVVRLDSMHGKLTAEAAKQLGEMLIKASGIAARNTERAKKIAEFVKTLPPEDV